MTPKEKAEELFNQYANVIYDRALTVMQYEICKQCALIAVNELIKYHDDLMDVVRYELPSNIVAVIPYKYWEEVKQEIESL